MPTTLLGREAQKQWGTFTPDILFARFTDLCFSTQPVKAAPTTVVVEAKLKTRKVSAVSIQFTIHKAVTVLQGLRSAFGSWRATRSCPARPPGAALPGAERRPYGPTPSPPPA